MNENETALPRRSFLGHFGAGLVGAGATRAAAAAPAAEPNWHPARHELDDWLDKIPGQHRFVFDNTTPEGFGHALLFANNYFAANMNAYGLKESDLAVVILARHHSTPYIFNDAMWARYGETIVQQFEFQDPKTKKAPRVNLMNVTGYGMSLPNNGVTLDAIIKRGAQFAVCSMATRFYAGRIATAVGAKPEDVLAELTSNLFPNCHLVPAGIVAVNRAQERGYSFVHA